MYWVADKENLKITLIGTFKKRFEVFIAVFGLIIGWLQIFFLIHVLGIINKNLVNSVSQQFSLSRIVIKSSCLPPDTNPPITLEPPLPIFNISYCTINTLQLRNTIFYDSFDKESYKMQLDLVNMNGKDVFYL